jgi:HTH-type transcriptional regulator / antitoxin HigA
MTKQEDDRALAITEKLTFDRNQTPQERAIDRLLVMSIEAAETKHYPLPTFTSSSSTTIPDRSYRDPI